MIPTDWVEVAEADNGTATATKAAKTDGRHTIANVSASFGSSSVSKLLTITCTVGGAAKTIKHVIHGADVLPLDLICDKDTSFAAALAASGTGGTLGYVTIVGHTDG